MSDTDGKMIETQKPPAKRRWGRIILTVSLALNVLFIGAILGAGWMRRHHGSGWQGPPDFVVKRLLRDLPEDKRRAILDQIKTHKKAMGPEMAQIASRKKQLKEALTGEPFNAANVRQAAVDLKMARRGFIEAKTELIVSVLEKLSPVERAKILESRHFRHLFGRRGGWGTRHH